MKSVTESNQIERQNKSVVNLDTQKARLQDEISSMQTVMFQAWKDDDCDLATSLEQGILSRRSKLADLEADN